MIQKLKNSVMLLIFFASAIAVCVIAVFAYRTLTSTADMLEASTRAQMSAMGEAVSLMVTADQMDLFMEPNDMQTPAYSRLKRELLHYAERNGLMYAYFMRYNPDDNQMYFIIDNVVDPEEWDGLTSAPVGREPAVDGALEGDVTVADVGSYSKGWDGLLSAFAPVYYSDGSPSTVVAGVDMQDTMLKAVQRSSARLAVVLSAALVAVLATCMACLNLYRRKARQWESASHAKGAFLSRMSHEMRTPLNAISGLSDMALAEGDTAVVRDYLGKIRTSADHLRHVIDDVLDISKIESGKLTLEIFPGFLRREIDDIDRIIRPQTDARRQVFAVTVGNGVPEAARFDPTHLRQVLINLLSNAVKFTPEGGRIELSAMLTETRAGRANIRWTVRDNGIGMDESATSRLFVPFEQAEASTSRKYGGTGLGMTISRQLVEMMGGTITVSSALGEGTEFVFNTWLEICCGDEVETDGSSEDDEPVDLTGMHVLMVEDSEMNQLIAVNMLEQFGATVDIADNGLIGVEAFTRDPGRYDLIFMDIQMPVMDGYEATRNIRASGLREGRTVPIIAITANVFKEDVERAMKAGMNGHVRKPLDIDQVKRTLRQVLPAAVKKEPVMAGRPTR